MQLEVCGAGGRASVPSCSGCEVGGELRNPQRNRLRGGSWSPSSPGSTRVGSFLTPLMRTIPIRVAAGSVWSENGTPVLLKRKHYSEATGKRPRSSSDS